MEIVPDQFDRLVAYMHERERIRIRKEAGQPFPWSQDIIFQSARFTNIRRSDDKTTRWLKNNWITPNKGRDPLAEFRNVAVFRWVGTIEFAQTYGWQPHWSKSRLIAVIEGMMAQKRRPFTSAYVISNFGLKGSKAAVVGNVIDELNNKLEALIVHVDEHQTWESADTFLRDNVSGFGGTGFMSKEVLTDAMETSFFGPVNDLFTWSPFGPGARRGLVRAFGQPLEKKINSDVALRLGRALYSALSHGVLNEDMPQPYKDFTLHDLQFVMCEFDKYERIRLGQGRSKRGYSQ